ncbi:MAG: hypothetical protein KC486_25935 [Myxococcales bacterium]|nr:hypothetical protein [Myxococcales bacterium]MCB9596788.1 hypothetical protein [Sandaracinaceae bacterium]
MRFVLPLAALLTGCVQLVAFDQPIIGQPDYVPGEGQEDVGLCDGDIRMGESALCSESCEIDAASGETTCGERVSLDGDHGTIDVSGLYEVEVTVMACRREGDLFRIVGGNGATITMHDDTLRVVAAAEANAQPYEDEEFFAEDDDCEDRTLLLQTGRMSLTDSGRRLCSDHLVPVDGAWTVEMSRRGVRSVELCFREPS